MIRTLVALMISLAVLCGPASATQKRKAQTGSATARARAAAARLDASPDPAALFPSSTLSYTEVRDVASAAEELGGVDALYRSIGALLAQAPTGGAPVKMPLTLEQFRVLLGSRLAIGMLQPAPRPGASTLAAFAEPEIVFVFKVPSEQAAAELSLAFAKLHGPPATARQQTQTIAGVKVLVDPKDTKGNQFALASAGMTTLFGSLGAVRSILTGAGNAASPKLAADPAFQSAVRRFGDRHHVFAFVNGRPLAKLFNEGLETAMSGPRKSGTLAKKNAVAEAIKRFFGLDALTGITLAAVVEAGELRVQTALELDRARTGLVSILSDPPALTMRSASFVPEGVDVLLVSSVDHARIFDLVMELTTAEVERGLGVPIGAQIRAIEESLGMKIREEIIPAFGTETALGYAEDRTPREPDAPDGPVRNDRVFVAVEVRNPDIVRRLLMKTLAEPGSELEVIEREDAVVIKRATMACAISDGYLVISEPENVEAALEAHRSNKTVLASRSFVAASGAIPAESIAALYLAPTFFDDVFKARAQAMTGLTGAENPLPNGFFASTQKDASGVYSEIRVNAGPAWRWLLSLFEKKETPAPKQ